MKSPRALIPPPMCRVSTTARIHCARGRTLRRQLRPAVMVRTGREHAARPGPERQILPHPNQRPGHAVDYLRRRADRHARLGRPYDEADIQAIDGLHPPEVGADRPEVADPTRPGESGPPGCGTTTATPPRPSRNRPGQPASAPGSNPHRRRRAARLGRNPKPSRPGGKRSIVRSCLALTAALSVIFSLIAAGLSGLKKP